MENWLGSSLNQKQGWTTVRESYSHALEQGPLAVHRGRPPRPDITTSPPSSQFLEICKQLVSNSSALPLLRTTAATASMHNNIGLFRRLRRYRRRRPRRARGVSTWSGSACRKSLHNLAFTCRSSSALSYSPPLRSAPLRSGADKERKSERALTKREGERERERRRRLAAMPRAHAHVLRPFSCRATKTAKKPVAKNGRADGVRHWPDRGTFAPSVKTFYL